MVIGGNLRDGIGMADRILQGKNSGSCLKKELSKDDFLIRNSLILLFLFDNLFVMTITTILIQDHQVIKVCPHFHKWLLYDCYFWLFYRSLRGYFQNLAYLRLDKFLSYAFIVNLYLQLIFGLLLFVNPAAVSGQEVVGQDITMKLVTKAVLAGRTHCFDAVRPVYRQPRIGIFKQLTD